MCQLLLLQLKIHTTLIYRRTRNMHEFDCGDLWGLFLLCIYRNWCGQAIRSIYQSAYYCAVSHIELNRKSTDKPAASINKALSTIGRRRACSSITEAFIQNAMQFNVVVLLNF